MFKHGSERVGPNKFQFTNPKLQINHKFQIQNLKQRPDFSPAAGQKSGQFNRERNFEKANNEYRIRLRRIEVRYSIDLYLSKMVRAKRFHISSFDISCSIFVIQYQPNHRQKTAGLIEK
jgi:hypothetical protein